MTKEYNSLVYETKAIEPVKLGDLEQESVEFVPGKLVTVRKAGPDGGKKKCRAVVCGNLLQGDLDPSPGSPYASGADGVLIRAALAFSVEKRWGIETTDIRTAFLHAPRPKKDDVREDSMLQLKVVAMIAALAAVASRRDVASKAGSGVCCGCGGFCSMVGGRRTYAATYSDRPKEVCSEGWEEEETIRAIGLQKVVKKSQDARGDEPAKTNLPRENEPGRKKDFSKENELEELRPDNQLALHNKEKEGESAKVGLKRVFVEPLVDSDDSFVEAYVEANLHGRAQQIAEDYDEHHGRGVLRLTEESSIHYCPSGCPRSEVPSGPFAMASLDEGPKVAALRIAPSLCGGDDSGLGGEPEAWEEKKFCEPPKHRKDEWLDCWLDRGWLVRSHGTERTRRFHPVHKGNPIHADLLNGDRVTIGFSDQDERKVEKDRWTNAPGDLYTPKKLWKGWTFLRLKQPLVSNLGQRFAGGVEGGFGNPRAATSGGAEIPTSSSGPGLSEHKRYLESAGSKPFPHEGEFHGDGKNESSLKKQVRGYKKSGLVDKGRVVASQLCKPPGLDDKVGEWEEESDGEWERVSEAS
eukprot:symbB.v1.2.024844.t1/scaffold2378.1/size80641/3